MNHGALVLCNNVVLGLLSDCQDTGYQRSERCQLFISRPSLQSCSVLVGENLVPVIFTIFAIDRVVMIMQRRVIAGLAHSSWPL